MYPNIHARLAVAIFAGAFILSTFITGCNGSSSDTEGGSVNTYTLGALVPETGDASEVGQTVKAAIELALEDVNSSDISSETKSTVALKTHDTESNFITADEGIKALKKENVDIVVGPVLSASCYIVKDYADENDMLLISPSATAASLAIQDDNLMRLVLDDALQAEALANHIMSQGITKLAVFTQTDIYGEGLLAAVAEKYQEKGGEFIAAYNMRGVVTEEDIRPQLSDLGSLIQNEIATTPAENIGVMLILFQEGVTLMKYAGEYSHLRDIKWFGTDSLAQNTMIIDDPVTAAFAEAVGFTCSSMSTLFFDQEKSMALEARITERTGIKEVSVFGILAYDATMLAAQALMTTGSTDPDLLRQEIRDLTATYKGPSSPIILNSADDRTSPNHFDLWSVQSESGKYVWVQDSYSTQ